MKMAPALMASGAKLIDLGADFRLKSRTDWESKYGRRHDCWELVEEAVYGITELHRDAIRHTRIVANPGCYSSASILGLAPLIKSGLVEAERLVVDGLSGTTGVGAETNTPSHHPEIANNIVPYNVVDHRHTYEIEQELRGLTTDTVSVHFTSAYVPITRGILAICHCFLKKRATRDDLLGMYRAFYAGHPFVAMFDMPKEENASWQYLPYPWVAAVSGTNYCHIGLEVDEKRNRVVVFSVLDSIGKGGAHVGVQNMNLMLGLPEEMGLTRRGLHPY
jgi:N-acetyl-gamma-glutamyl-phosphate reductase common form